MFDVIALGEVLIDFTYAGKSAGDMKLFEQNPGGAPANLLTAVSHMGLRTAFIGKVGTDMHGQFLKETLEKEEIDTSNLIMDEAAFTTLAFVGIDEKGERAFSFARKPGADTMLRKEELDPELLVCGKVLHVGSLSLTHEPARSATFEAVKVAKAAGAVISYDPNYRASLWPDAETAVQAIRTLMPYADLMKVSDEESELLTGEKDYKKAAELLLRQGAKVIAVTLGGEGVYMAVKGDGILVPGFAAEAVDTTGAGDSFWGGFLSRFVKSKKSLEEITIEDLKTFALFGNATASLCVRSRGGIPAIPYEDDVKKLLEK